MPAPAPCPARASSLGSGRRARVTTTEDKTQHRAPHTRPDAEIEALVAALDDDGGGELSVDEIADFIERGTDSVQRLSVQRGDERLALGVRDDARGHLEVVADELLELLGVEVAVARLVVALEQLLQRLALRRRL